jgi:signal transduction histidine kinase
VEVAAYRIALEAMNNARRHSGADNCWVNVKVDQALTLEIVDDGNGLASEHDPGVGITSMRERTSELGADLHIVSSPESGTSVKASFPLQRLDAV